MDFSLSPEQQALVDTVRKFARNRLAPSYKAREKAECVERDLILEMGQMGFLGPELP